jgi:hypothetical protein
MTIYTREGKDVARAQPQPKWPWAVGNPHPSVPTISTHSAPERKWQAHGRQAVETLSLRDWSDPCVEMRSD